ncbi:hypothetical protein [Marinilabilia sp.]|uniref:hypothetical protein n=1 Tax=Marinilabilia sp. TaxID=2021252 RepID=UPI0025BD06E9|nr:hypothetical protein [Marinilabilia sp.]
MTKIFTDKYVLVVACKRYAASGSARFCTNETIKNPAGGGEKDMLYNASAGNLALQIIGYAEINL